MLNTIKQAKIKIKENVMSKKEILLQINFNHEDHLYTGGFPVDVLVQVKDFKYLKSHHQNYYSHLPFSIYCLLIIGVSIRIIKENMTDNLDNVTYFFLQALSYTYQNFPKLLDDPIFFSDENGCMIDVSEEQSKYIEQVDQTSKDKMYFDIQTKNDGSIQFKDVKNNY